MSDLRVAAAWLALTLSAGMLPLLAGCATSGGTTAAASADASETYVRDAGLAFQAGDTPRAVGLLQQAAAADPDAVDPWLRLAQVHFDGGRYAPAIIAAQEVLARNPRHHTAQSIAAVSALRIARDELAALNRDANLEGSVREEAQMLTNEMRQTLSDQLYLPGSEPASRRDSVRPEPRKNPARRQSDRVAQSSVNAAKNSSPASADSRRGDPFNPFETLQSLPQ